MIIRSNTLQHNSATKYFFLKAILFLLCILGYSAAHAQYNNNNMNYGGPRSGFGLVLGAGLDVPMHNFDGVYRAAPAFDAGVTKRFGHFILGLNLGYREYQPKQGTYELTDTDPDYGTISYGTVSYSNYGIFSVYASGAYDIKIDRGISLRPGINLGSYYTHYSLGGQSGSYSESYHLKEEFGYFAPKLGINFALSEDLQLGIETRYNMFGSASVNYSYNSYDGGSTSSSSVLYTTWGTSVTLSYQFP